VGIAIDSIRFDRNERPQAKGDGLIVRYNCNGSIQHISDEIEGNSKFFEDGNRVTLEFNMDSNPRSLTFFYECREQKNYVVNIPESVRVYV
ncbi:MAG: hypothetical protein EZS28_053925, partial [Streblomastix strix]